jgi:nitrite reductase/ring-hydroxylating ferredoxin subunit
MPVTGAAPRSTADPTPYPVAAAHSADAPRNAAVVTPPTKVEQATAPPAERFAAFPAAWYLFCTAEELRAGPVAKRVYDRDLVAFRPAPGQVVVMDAQCSHLGADLARGKVVNGCLECPFHSWRYAADGRCVHIPDSPVVPEFARQRCYPAQERHGLVFFFNGRQPLFPLPFFAGENPDDFVAGRPATFIANCTWYMVAAHGYDTQHFDTVHARRLLAPPVIDCPAPYARRCSYSAEVVGQTIWDRLLRRFAGKTVEITITTWGGTLVVMTGRFARARSDFMIATQPLEDGRTRCDVFVFCRRSRSRLARAVLQPLSLAVRRMFTRGYLVDEVASLGSPKYNPNTLIAVDREMIDYFRWVCELTRQKGA